MRKQYNYRHVLRHGDILIFITDITDAPISSMKALEQVKLRPEINSSHNHFISAMSSKIYKHIYEATKYFPDTDQEFIINDKGLKVHGHIEHDDRIIPLNGKKNLIVTTIQQDYNPFTGDFAKVID